MGILSMSGKERRRVSVLSAIKKGELSLAEGAKAMRISYRQAKRVWKRYQKGGDAGLVHRSRGGSGSQGIEPKERRKILGRYQERYGDFGPTLAAEYLSQEGMKVDHETLRRWLIQAGHWTVVRGRPKHRQWRERKPCFGQMVQMDGSHHDWFEGRREKAVLMVMVDDATNHTLARFSEQETTRDSYNIFERWNEKHGLPLSLYVDRDGIYRCERLPTVNEQVTDEKPCTQFGRAMAALAVELILANSPQAKGRVERRNGLLQDRLVKALRLERISEPEMANQFLEKTFLPALNKRFCVPAASLADMHRPRPRNLDEVLSWEDERVVRKDWTVAWEGRWFQIPPEHEKLSLAGRNIIVRCLRNGDIQLVYRERKLSWAELPDRPIPSPKLPRRVGRIQLVKPLPEHPWRHGAIAAGKQFWKQTKAQGRAVRSGTA
jgi:molybdenum-dependent DNA-binding transcriptional regulator ModE